MRNIQEAEQLIQEAYNIDVGKQKGEIDAVKAIEKVGVMSLHIYYYDAGLAQMDEIRGHLRQFPDGQLAKLIMGLRDARLVNISERL